ELALVVHLRGDAVRAGPIEDVREDVAAMPAHEYELPRGILTEQIENRREKRRAFDLVQRAVEYDQRFALAPSRRRAGNVAAVVVAPNRAHARKRARSLRRAAEESRVLHEVIGLGLPVELRIDLVVVQHVRSGAVLRDERGGDAIE